MRTDFTAGEVRRFAKRVKDAAQARRLLAIAAVLDGASREDAAKIGGMDRQRGGRGGGVPPKLGKKHRAFLARLVEEGPIPAVHGVVRWRACDLIMRLHEEFGLSVSDDTIYRALKDLGFSHVSARPRAYKQDPDAMEAFKKTLPTAWRKSAPSLRRVHRQRSGSRTRCGSARRTSSLIAGPGRARDPEPRMISAPSRPICSARSAPNMEPALPSFCPSATPKPCSFISMRSAQG